MAYIVIRIKGKINVPHWAKQTMASLNLHKKFWATILPENSESLGMLRKVKDFVAWCPVDADIIKELLVKKGKAIGSQPIGSISRADVYNGIDDLASSLAADRIRLSKISEIRPWFALNPPRGGFKKKTKIQS